MGKTKNQGNDGKKLREQQAREVEYGFLEHHTGALLSLDDWDNVQYLISEQLDMLDEIDLKTRRPKFADHLFLNNLIHLFEDEARQVLKLKGYSIMKEWKTHDLFLLLRDAEGRYDEKVIAAVNTLLSAPTLRKSLEDVDNQQYRLMLKLFEFCINAFRAGNIDLMWSGAARERIRKQNQENPKGHREPKPELERRRQLVLDEAKRRLINKPTIGLNELARAMVAWTGKKGSGLTTMKNLVGSLWREQNSIPKKAT